AMTALFWNGSALYHAIAVSLSNSRVRRMNPRRGVWLLFSADSPIACSATCSMTMDDSFAWAWFAHRLTAFAQGIRRLPDSHSSPLEPRLPRPEYRLTRRTILHLAVSNT